jgi:hypothetical protein
VDIKRRVENLEKQTIERGGGCNMGLTVIEVCGDTPLTLPTEAKITKHLKDNNLCRECQGSCNIIFSKNGFGSQSKYWAGPTGIHRMLVANPETIDLMNRLPNGREVNKITVVSENAKELTERILNGERPG